MERFIKLQPKILISKIFTHPTALKIWIWCLCKASYKKEFVPLSRGKGRGNIIVELLPRQFVFGRLKAAKELKINGNTIYWWLRKFASDEFDKIIEISTHSSYSIITISKYVNYQGSGNGSLTGDSQVRFNRNNTINQDMSDIVLSAHQHNLKEEVYKGKIINAALFENLKDENCLLAAQKAREPGELFNDEWVERMKRKYKDY